MKTRSWPKGREPLQHRQPYTGETLTFLAPEPYAYPNGAQTRPCRAFFADDGQLRRVWAGIADTYFTVPAHARRKGRYVRGFLMQHGHSLVFHVTGESGQCS